MRLLVRMTLQHRLARVEQPPIGYDGRSEEPRHDLLTQRAPIALDGTSIGLSMPVTEPFLPPSVYEMYERIVPEMQIPKDLNSLTAERKAAVDAGYVRLDEVVNFLPGDRLDEDDLELFRDTIRLYQRREIDVIVLMLPMHPYFYDVLLDQTRHASHLETLRRLLSDLKSECPRLRVALDVSHIARFGGDPRAFHDNYHMSPQNTDRVLQRAKLEWDVAR
jgi:hypothetical protein